MKIVFGIIFLLLVSPVFSQSSIRLSKKDSINCQLFKNSYKSERKQYFDKIKYLIVLAKTESSDDPNIQKYTSLETLYEMFGRPNFHQTDLIFGYYLSSLNKTCLVEFELNKLNKIKKFTLKNCK